MNFEWHKLVISQESLRDGFADSGQLTSEHPGLYDVSVRNLTILARMWPTATNQVGTYATHSQASYPRSVTLPQLPSPRTSQIKVTSGMLPLRRLPLRYRGLSPHKFTPQWGVPVQPERRLARFLSSKRFGRRPVNLGVGRTQRRTAINRKSNASTTSNHRSIPLPDTTTYHNGGHYIGIV